MERQIYKLKDIATIVSGYSFRSKVQNNPDGDTYVIKMRDISPDRTNIANSPHKFNGSKIHEKHLLQNGDILFMAKGANNFAVNYHGQLKPSFAASAFFVIRINNKSINPAFICIYINSAIGQHFFKANMAGTYIPNINKATLNDMVLFIPPMDEQNKIIALHGAHRKEKELLRTLLSKKELMMNELIKNLITGKNL